MRSIKDFSCAPAIPPTSGIIPSPPVVMLPPGRAHRLHAGLGLGEGAGREPGRGSARALLHAAAGGWRATKSSIPGCSIDASPTRIVAENPVTDDGWSNRGTFTGDAEASMAAKRAGVGFGPDEEAADRGTPAVARLSLNQLGTTAARPTG
jgi:hypothetical protein